MKMGPFARLLCNSANCLDSTHEDGADCFETSVTKFQRTPHNIPEEWPGGGGCLNHNMAEASVPAFPFVS